MIPLQAQIYNVMIWILWMTVANILLPRKLKLLPTILIEIALYVPYTILVTMVIPYYSIWRTVIGEGLIFLVFFLLHGGKWYTRTIIIFLMMVASFIADMAIYYLLGPERATAATVNPYDFPVPLYAASFLFNAILLSILTLSGFSLRKRYDLDRGTPGILLLVLFPVSQFVLLICIMKTGWLTEQTLSFREVALVFLSVVISDAGLLLLVRRIAESTAERERTRAKAEETELKKRYLASLAVDEKHVKAMEQAVSEQFGEIERKILEGRTDGELELAEGKAVEQLFQKKYPECGNRLIADYLFRREEEISRRGFRTDFSAAIPVSCGVSDTDFICALGNLLDNAREACEGLPDPWIRLIADYEPPYVRIRIENTCHEKESPREKRISGLERGLGSAILNKLADKYDGEYRTAGSGGIFTASLLLKGDTVCR